VARTRSGVQIIQPPEDAPRAGLEGGDHPFILEFPLKTSALQEITNQRRIRVHRQLTLLLNVLLRGHTTFQLPRSPHLWATDLDHGFESKWVCRRSCTTVTTELPDGVGETTIMEAKPLPQSRRARNIFISALTGLSWPRGIFVSMAI
jgi:hypothetical protein